MEIRKAGMEDIPEMVRLRIQQLTDEGDDPSDTDIGGTLTRFFTDMLTRDALVQFLCIDGEDVVATSGVCFYDYPPQFHNPTGRIGYITDMYTRPDHRRRGIATRMLDMAVGEAKARGITSIKIGASSDGRPVYLKYGFVPDISKLKLTF